MSHDFGISLQDQQRKNRWRTGYLFLMFPIIVLALTYIGVLLAIAFGNEVSTSDISFFTVVNEMMKTVGFWVIIAVFGWSLLSYFMGHQMILGFSGAKPIQKKDHPALVRAVENAALAAGLPVTPQIYIMDDQSLNAFATGRNPKNSMVAISKGLLDKLEQNELEAVMAHEVGHIVNRDIRVMMLSITLAGAIEMLGEILIRMRSSGKDSKGNPLPIIGFLFLTIGVLVGSLTRLAISREREYLADATSARLTSNPNALASALTKISADSRLEVLDGKASMAGLCIADPINSLKHDHNNSPKVSFWHKIWSTHPPMAERIKRLRNY